MLSIKNCHLNASFLLDGLDRPAVLYLRSAGWLLCGILSLLFCLSFKMKDRKVALPSVKKSTVWMVGTVFCKDLKKQFSVLGERGSFSFCSSRVWLLFPWKNFLDNLGQEKAAFSFSRQKDTLYNWESLVPISLLCLCVFLIACALAFWGMAISSRLRQAKKQEEEEADQKRQPLKETEIEQLELFSLIASHDLKEPLYKIMSFADLLKSNYAQILDDKGKDYLERLLNSCQQMKLITDRILEFSRVMTATHPFEPVHLSQIVANALHELADSINSKQAQVEVSPLPVIEGDPAQLSQLFIHLIENSLKFSRPSIPPHIIIYQSKAEGKGIEVVVSDNGIGFDEKYLHKLFKPFQRLHSSGHYEGIGMSLAICQKIMLRHGGKISASSQLNQGTTFHLFFPYLNQ